MECGICDSRITFRDSGQYRGVIGEKPDDWTACHVSCARQRQEQGAKITVRWYPIKS